MLLGEARWAARRSWRRRRIFSFMGGSMGMYVGNAIIALRTRGGPEAPADPVFRRREARGCRKVENPEP